MKLKFCKTVLPVLAAGLFSGCAAGRYTSDFAPPGGLLITDTKIPLTTRFNNTPVKTEVGKASTLYLHDCLLTGLDFAWDDCSIDRAAKNGGLETVEYADVEVFNVLGIFGKMTVTAYGDKKTE